MKKLLWLFLLPALALAQSSNTYIPSAPYSPTGTPTNGQVLTYVAATKTYTNAASSGGSGTVTSLTAGGGLTATPSPITTTGSFALDLTASNTFTGVPTYSATEPRIKFNQTGAGSDQKLWDIDLASLVFCIRTRTDADGAGQNVICATRSTTTTLSNLTFGYSVAGTYTFPFTGTATFSGAISSSGDSSVASLNVTGTNIPTTGISKSGGGSLLLNAAGVTGASISSGTNKVLGVNFSVISNGTKPTVTGCSNTTTLGGAVAGSYVSGTTGTCTVTITLPAGPTSGYACFAHDDTTAADYTQSAIVTSVTTLTISGTTVSGDKIVWACPFGY